MIMLFHFVSTPLAFRNANMITFIPFYITNLHLNIPCSFFTYQVVLFSSVVALEEQRTSLARELNTLKHTHSKVSILLFPCHLALSMFQHISLSPSLSVNPVSPDISGSAGKEKGAGERRIPSQVFHNTLICLLAPLMILFLLRMFCSCTILCVLYWV